MGRVHQMTMQAFIDANREELDRLIAMALKMDHNPRPTDAERRLWILNDERFYLWARTAGVRI